MSLATRQSLLLTSEQDFTLQTNAFIASDEIVFATHLQIRITLLTNMFIASDKRVLCWGRALLTLEVNAFRAEDERIENVQLPSRIYVEVTQLLTSEMDAITLRGSNGI